MAWAAAAIAAAGAAYSANQQKKAAEKAAKGSQVTPWGPTGGYMEDLLGGAMDAWNTGQFQFGPDPNVYNSYLDWGGNKLGLDTGGFQRIDPEQTGYGPEAYAWMLDLVQGPAWRGASQTNPSALVGVQDPWAAGLMGGFGGYAAAGGFDPPDQQQTQQMQTTRQMQSVLDAYQSVVNPSYYGYGF